VALGSRKSATQQQTTTNLNWRNWRSVLWRGGRTRGKRIEGSATKTALKKRPSWVAKKTVSYCNTSNSELENDEDGYELKKKAKANTTNSNSDEEATKRSAVTKPSAAVKSSIRVNERKLAAQPSTTDVVVELADKEKRATNKKIRTEVLQKIHECLKPLVLSIGKNSFLKW
jgi:hypothetical protein